MTLAPDDLSADDFRAWLASGAVRNHSDAARQLGCARNSIDRWAREGAPRYIALACAAISANVTPWRNATKATS